MSRSVQTAPSAVGPLTDSQAHAAGLAKGQRSVSNGGEPPPEGNTEGLPSRFELGSERVTGLRGVGLSSWEGF